MFNMDEKDKKIIIIKSGNGCKSIGSYIDNICKELIQRLIIEIKAYDNNMNKLITIEQIIKRALEKNKEKEINDSRINYEIGKDKEIPFIKCTIKINKEDTLYLKELIGNKKNKRNNHPFSKNENHDKMQIDEEEKKNKKTKFEKNLKEEDKINDLCMKNIENFFNNSK